MNPAIMMIVALIIAAEKLAPKPELVVRLTGAAALILGCVVILRPTLLQ